MDDMGRVGGGGCAGVANDAPADAGEGVGCMSGSATTATAGRGRWKQEDG